MAGVRDEVVPALSELTASLTNRHEPDAVLRQVTAACTRLLGASAIGVMLSDPRGGIRVVSASDERSRFVELLQTQVDEGPCVDCIKDGIAVASENLAADDRWPAFRPAALDAGYRAIRAVPMRLDGQTVGGLNLLYLEPVTLELWQQRLGEVLADLAVPGLSQEAGPPRVHRLTERTLTTLNDRVQLAHAVGLVAGTLDIRVDDARDLIVDHARERGTRVRDVARALTNGELDPSAVSAAR
ncbi:GAF and ANTAR domain-containing protein [Lentzea xinjiangensis]|uniref:GAF and ANTAR domain-containing protein n=1 Tax=Lentzea xinjiangensis TaxID=402600 RepID=UPI000B7C775F|nr:GAF and ANTAR domain-containing protein [Lentzea xinjiangensis]